MSDIIRVLQIEDSPTVVQLTRLMLAEAAGTNFELESVETLAAGIKRLARGGIDVVLLDLTLPDSQGLETFSVLHTTAAIVPIVIYTSLDDEEVSLCALRQGAADYLVKSEVNAKWLARSLTFALNRSHYATANGKGAKTASEPAARAIEIEKSKTSPGTFWVRINDKRMVSVVTMEAIKTRLLNLVRRKDCHVVHIDFSKVEYVANAAISTLLIVNKQAKTSETEFILSNISTQVYEQFSSRRFDKVFHIEQADSRA